MNEAHNSIWKFRLPFQPPNWKISSGRPQSILLRTAQNVRGFTLPTPHPGQYCSLGNIKDQVTIRHCSGGGRWCRRIVVLLIWNACVGTKHALNIFLHYFVLDCTSIQMIWSQIDVLVVCNVITWIFYRCVSRFIKHTTNGTRTEFWIIDGRRNSCYRRLILRSLFNATARYWWRKSADIFPPLGEVFDSSQPGTRDNFVFRWHGP